MFFQKSFFCKPLFFFAQELRKSVQWCTVEISATPTQRKKSCKQLLSQKSNSMPLFWKSRKLKKSTTPPTTGRTRFAEIWLQRVAPAKQLKLQKNRACRKSLTFTPGTLPKCFRECKHLGRLPDLAGRKFLTRPHWKGPHLGGGFSLPKSCPFDVFGKCSKSIPPNGPTAQCLGQFFSSKNKVF